MEQARGIEPPSTAWQAVIITIILHLRYSDFVSTSILLEAYKNFNYYFSKDKTFFIF